MGEDSGEKTEEPTGHKLSQARQKGQVAKSMEVSAAVVLLASCGALFILGPYGWGRVTALFRHMVWRAADFSRDPGDLIQLAEMGLKEVLIISLPVALIVLVFSVAINLYQLGGFMVSNDALVPKWDRLNFITGFMRFFKIRTVVDCVKSVLKMGIIFLVGYLVIRDHMEDFVLMVDMQPLAIGVLTLKIALELFLKTVLVLLILAVMDYGYQKWQFTQDMKMTKQEVKDEYKQIEGDPIVKNRIRQAQREAAKKRQLADVPKSDVVIANPEHFAVALRYDREKAPAPVVMAKGMDFMALRIKDIAREHKVPIVENRPLAQALYKAVEVGEVIPAEFYKAVAGVLSYIYKVKGRRQSGKAA
ncbi:MAG: flagellar biosynthesis protein FlhB [Deltaproteobacteria bacterium]|jgi:flagellar biosynthetic protein FlhB|nr:flagellar biosynthesis protein FlhB [Deltaproteobacteria bacterium]